jgi:hypothetical protein
MKRRSEHVDVESSSSESLPAVPAFSKLGLLSPLLLLPASIAPMVALWAPANVLDRWPWLRRFTAWMVEHVPAVEGHANSTIHPQMALLVNCLVIAAVPVLAAVVFWQAWANYPYLLKRRRQLGRLALKQHFVVALGLAIGAVLITAMVMIPGDPSWAPGATTHSRGFYAFSAFVVPYFTGLTLGTQLLNIRLFIDTYLKRETMQ